MAVTFGAAGAGTFAIGADTTNGIATQTFSQVVAADDNYLLYPLACLDPSIATNAVTAHSRSVTYNGVSMTSLGATPAATVGNGFIEWFGLAAPTVGTNNVIVTVTRLSTTSGGGTWAIMGNSLSYKGVASVTLGSPQVAASGTPSVSVSSTTGRRSVGMVCCAVNDPGGYNQTSRANITTTSYYVGITSNTQIGDAAGAATVTHSKSATGNFFLAQAVDLVALAAPIGKLTSVRQAVRRAAYV